MDFGEALNFLKIGKRVARIGWNCKNMYIAVEFPDEDSEMDGMYMYICNSSEELYPWNPGQQDLFAEDWIVLND